MYKVNDKVFIDAFGGLILPVKILKINDERMRVELLSNNCLGKIGEGRNTSLCYIKGFATPELMKIEDREELENKLK